MEFCWFVPNGVNNIFAMSQTLTRVKIRFVATHDLVLWHIPRFKKGLNWYYLGMGFYHTKIWNEKDLYRWKTDHSGKYVIPLWKDNTFIDSLSIAINATEVLQYWVYQRHEERLTEDSVLTFRYNSSSEGNYASEKKAQTLYRYQLLWNYPN